MQGSSKSEGVKWNEAYGNAKKLPERYKKEQKIIKKQALTAAVADVDAAEVVTFVRVRPRVGVASQLCVCVRSDSAKNVRKKAQLPA